MASAEGQAAAAALLGGDPAAFDGLLSTLMSSSNADRSAAFHRLRASHPEPLALRLATSLAAPAPPAESIEDIESDDHSVLEEKATACNMLCHYDDEGLFPWLDQVNPSLVPLLKFYFHEEVRRAAVAAMPKLLRLAKLAVEKGQAQGRDQSYAKQLSDYIIPALVEALHKEPETEMCSSMLDSLNECMQFPGLLLDETQVRAISDEIKNVIIASATQKREHSERTKAEDFDCDEGELLKEENEQEEEGFDKAEKLASEVTRRYDDRELEDFLFKWIRDDDYSGLKKLDIYSYDVSDLHELFGSDEFYILVELHKMEDGSIMRTLNKRTWKETKTYPGKLTTKKLFRYLRDGAIAKGVLMTEYSQVGGPKDKVLCKVTFSGHGPISKSPTYGNMGGMTLRSRCLPQNEKVPPWPWPKVMLRQNLLLTMNNSDANGGMPSVSADGGGGAAEAAPSIKLSGREGESKNDFKGKVKARAEQEKLRGAMDSENTSHTELEAQLSNAIEELKAAKLDLARRCESLEESLNKEKSEKLIALESYEKEKLERESAESSRAVLTGDLERVTHDAKQLSEQLKMVQDTNKNLQEYNTSLQQYNINLQADASKSGETISKLQKEKSAMMETLAILRACKSSMDNELESSRVSEQEAIRVKEELRKEMDCLRIELMQVTDDHDHSVIQLNSLNIELGKTSKECDSFSTKVSELEETCNTQQEQIRTLQKQLGVATEKLKLADVTAIEAMTGYEEQKEKIKYLEERLAQAEFQIVEGDKLRKKLHNTILELKGNIRVFCRVRPLLRFDGDSNGPEGASISFPTSVESAGRGIDLINQGQKLSFSYDKVFNHDASQEDVFVEISQLVQSALDGYKVCIFAYGQTGSGKTYTMMGKPGIDQKGIISRSLEQIFETSQFLESQGWNYSMKASMLEIYNDTIRDLLAPGRSKGFEMMSSKTYTIKHDRHGNTTVSELTIIDVFGIADVTSLLEKASQSRSVGKTQMNEESSRSHFVFTLKISGSNENTGQHVQGVLNLIDLAGSERLGKSGSTGDRLKETLSINKSLSALNDVIFAIANGDDHVPFRNSKLTYLLQPCLRGDSKVLMFVNISPEASSVAETISSLRFASRVNGCEIEKPRR